MATELDYLKKIQKRIKEGYGQGEGKNYKPWIKVNQVPSRGRSSTPMGWITGREHHLLSDLETYYFFILQWSGVPTDIREQFPLLPIEETLDIAGEIGVPHPANPYKKYPEVMTTDFLINIGEQRIGRTAKYVKDLNSTRKIEKLEIERIYWERRGVNWGVVTEKEIDMTLVDNIMWVQGAFFVTDEQKANKLEKILRKNFCADIPLSDWAMEMDTKLGQDEGTSLLLVRHFIAHKKWAVDMGSRIIPSKPLTIISFNPDSEKLSIGG